MADEWYYVEDGEPVGPVSAAALARRIDRAPEEAHLVWAPGMPEWVDGRALPQFSLGAGSEASPRPRADAPVSSAPTKASAPAPRADAAQGMGADPEAGAPKTTLLQRARREFLSYLAVSTYLMVWFSAMMFYKSAILRGVGIEFAPLGVAVVKALILGKFILGLEAVKLGERRGKQAILIVQIVARALIFTVALVLMSIVEEIVVGHFHGRSVAETMGEMAGGSAAQLFAASLLLFLVLVPYLAFRRIAQDYGELPELLFTRHGLEKRS